MEYIWQPYPLSSLPLERPSGVDVHIASLYPPQIVAAGSYQRSASPPPFCIDPKWVDPGFGLPKTEEEWTYPLSMDYLSDPEPAESSSSRASSATPSDSDVENVPIPPASSSPQTKPTLHLARKKLKTTMGGWGTKLLKCGSCGTMVQERQMQRHVLHKHPKPGQSVPAALRTCKRCNQVFSRVDAMKRHKRKCTAGRR